jgi:hypothetical protein
MRLVRIAIVTIFLMILGAMALWGLTLIWAFLVVTEIAVVIWELYAGKDVQVVEPALRFLTGLGARDSQGPFRRR